MGNALEAALQKALAVRLNLQISLSQLAIVEEWMDIHLDRWLEHNPTPPEMPDGEEAHYLAMLGSDLQRLWWGAWGDPRGFVPKLADYFKLCNIARSDSALLDQMGEALEPRQVGSWIAAWGGKVVTGWHFLDAQPWAAIESMFGTHEAKFALKRWVDDHEVAEVQRFTQAIGDAPFSELEIAVAGAGALSSAFVHFTGAPLAPAVVSRIEQLAPGHCALSLRIRGGAISRVGAALGGLGIAEAEALCSDAGVPCDPKLAKLTQAVGDRVVRVEYARAGDKAGVDVYVEPGTSNPMMPAPAQAN